MSSLEHIEWDPHAEPPPHGALAEYDRLRKACAVARGEGRQWYVFRHEDVMRVLLDHETFSNVVSERVSAPNGMDPPEHTPVRALIDQFFLPEAMAQFDPACRAIAEDLVSQALTEGRVEVMSALGYPFAARAQCAFLGWPEELNHPLVDWTLRNQQAARLRDRVLLDALGQEFEELVRRAFKVADSGAECAWVTRALATAQVDGKPLPPAELISILRNWTVGEIGSLASSIGVILHAITEDQELQRVLRAQPEKRPPAIDEILRVHGPLISNRRRATRDVQLGGRQVAAGDTVHVVWVSANRDEGVFEAPEEIRPERDSSKNLVYGAGIHVCPGAPLARLEMRVFLEACLAATSAILPAPSPPPNYSTYPASGYSTIHVVFAG